jgi:hypothetical protein
MATQEEYDAHLQDRMIETKSVSTYGDRALKYFCEAEMDRDSRSELLQMAQTMSLMDIANTLREIARKT